jgi:DNA-binding transcriptional LysR family regulator
VARHDKPETPTDLARHICLRQRFSTGRLIPWTLRSAPDLHVPASMTASIIDALLDLALAGAGIASFPEFLVRDALASGRLLPILEERWSRPAS